LLAVRTWPGVVERIEPARGHAAIVELDIRDFFARRWNDDSVRSASLRAGYNGFTPLTDPVTGETVHVLGLWLDRPGHPGTHFLIRRLDGTYGAADVEFPVNLRATRCIVQSPFGEASIYLGGFDNADSAAQYSAWIARGAWTAWPDLTMTSPDPPLRQLNWQATGPAWRLEESPDLTVWQPAAGFPASSPTATTQSIDPATNRRRYFRLHRE
jgi:hypothetical protein